jgi:hypothetical protein
MPSISDIQTLHNRYQDSMVQAFELHLREIVMRVQARVIAKLQGELTTVGGVIEATPANLLKLRRAQQLFMKELDDAGYPRLVNAFVGEFKGTLQFLDQTIEQLGGQAGQEWKAQLTRRDQNLLATVQANAAWTIEDAMRAVAGNAITRGLFSVAGLRFGSLVEMLTDRLDVSIARARTIADTAMSHFYATAAARAYDKIAADLPEHVLLYRYSGPVDTLERPFCRHLTDLDQGYTRDRIDRMDNGQIPNVFISRGGWNCRHQWIIDTRPLEEKRPAVAQRKAA